MTLSKRYKPQTREPEIQARWEENGVYHFAPHDDERTLYAIDTPPPTVSGRLHLGHVYSYSHTDFMARFWRMNGYNVYYPMGFDDNGLPTERLVERERGVTAREAGRRAFVQACLETGEEAEKAYEALWQRLGLSVDWRYIYRTIEDRSQRIAQWSFLDLYHRDLAYRRRAPTIWCPECQTAIAQAEVDDLGRESTFYTLAFTLDDGRTLPIATTRPELLPACVAIFLHPDDARSDDLAGRTATVPLFGQEAPILADPGADPEKGTGVVMCCTFGDTADVDWWYRHNLPLVEAIDRQGRMRAPAGDFAGLPIPEARRQIVTALDDAGLLLDAEPTQQTVGIHERCDTPIEFMVTPQWFVRVLDFKESLLAAGERVTWHPPHMHARYRQWVENLAWDWCISRQRAFGVPFPIWYCDGCDAVAPAPIERLPVDPTGDDPPPACPECGGRALTPEADVMDTWATSSMSPQIAGGFTIPGEQAYPGEGHRSVEEGLYNRLFPFTLRPQAHEIIRTWAFYTIVKSHHHFGAVPWEKVAISGWGLAPEGSAKLSKSRGGGPVAPLEMIETYSADAVRYWASSTGFGKDSVIDEEKIQAGAKLVTKLWNVARFAHRFLADDPTVGLTGDPPAAHLTVADRWLLSRTQRLIARVTDHFEAYDYAAARSETERAFWTMADNYLEMAKKRLYEGGPQAAGAVYTLSHALLTTVKLLAPFLTYVTEAIYQGVLETDASVHNSHWPQADEALLDEPAEAAGETLVEIATAVRRYKSEAGISLGTELAHLHLAPNDPELAALMRAAEPDLASITRAVEITVGDDSRSGLQWIQTDGAVRIALAKTN